LRENFGDGLMLKYHEKERKKAVTSMITERKTTIRSYLQKHKKRMVGLFVFVLLCGMVFTVVLPNINLEFMPFSDVKPQKLDRISEYAFRKIIGYGYEEKIYVKDTAEIRSRLEADSMIFGDVEFIVKLIPFYELEVAFKESSPLFTLISQRSDTVPVIYSDKGKIYPYSTNAADLPVVDANNPVDIFLATNFLMDMKKNDAMLYTRVSQLIPRTSEKQITVFFNDVDFKTVFSLERDYWKTAFRHYRQLTRNMQNLNINSIAVLDLRFRNLAYTKEKDGGL
jgi:cell division septal protein FtsQ